MDARQLLVLGASMLASCLGGPAMAAETQEQYVCIAELEIDPGELAALQAAIKERRNVRSRRTGFRLDTPFRKTMILPASGLEIYTDADAYRTQSGNTALRKFRAVTETMVRSRKSRSTLSNSDGREREVRAARGRSRRLAKLFPHVVPASAPLRTGAGTHNDRAMLSREGTCPIAL